MIQNLEDVIDEISQRRKLAKLSQKELAKLSGVSQSTIAKIENHHETNFNPSYGNIRKILMALEKTEVEKGKGGVKARDVMNRKVVGIQKSDKVGKAMRIMERKAYSRLPVFNGKYLVGSISESTIYREIVEGKYLNLHEIGIEKIMDEAFPIIDENTPKESFLSLLRFSPAILASRKGEIVGIITKADLLKME